MSSNTTDGLEADNTQCLRCGVALFDAGGLRRCRDCGWVEHRPAD